jgi:hypothetical protein
MRSHEHPQLTRNLTQEQLVAFLERTVRVDLQEFNVSPKGCD